MPYKTILKTGAQIVWQWQGLLIFGLLAAFFGPGRVYTFLRSWTLPPGDLSGSYLQNLIWRYELDGVFRGETLTGISQLTQTNPGRLAGIIAVFLTALGVVIFFAWVSSIAQGAIIKTINRLKAGEIAKFKISWREGRRSAWTVWNINLLNKLVWVLLGILLWGLLARNEYFFNLSHVAIFLTAVLIGLIISAVARLAILNAATYNDGFGASISTAAGKFKNNFKAVLGLALVTALAEWLILILVATLVAALSVPLGTIIGATTFLTSGFLFTSSVIFANLVTIVIEIVALSALTAYIWTLWAQAWPELN